MAGARQYREAGADLIERARTDRAAFGEIYDIYLQRVYAFCWSYSATREAAEDLAAQTFERALGAIARYEDRGAPFSSWLLRIAANLARDRARSPVRETSGEDGDIVDERPDEAEDADPATRAARWERAAWLRAHIETLPPDQQRAIQLRFWDDLPWAEVGAALGRSEDAAKQLMRRALKALAATIGEEGRDA